MGFQMTWTRRWAVLFTTTVAIVAAGCGTAPSDFRSSATVSPSDGKGDPTMSDSETKIEKVVKSDAEWKAQLTSEQYRITRRAGTERAFTGEYWDNKAEGTYHCICCDQPLYPSSTKYESGTGWPSFWDPVSNEAVAMKADRKLFVVRTELLCSRCDAHLGHVFTDGPDPSGHRHCLNSASLRFVPKDDEKPNG